jgi:YbbR domain-containing protein
VYKLGNWLKSDWALRLLALVLACYFWYIQDKPVTEVITRPVKAINMPGQLVLVSQLPPVDITITGLQRDINKAIERGLEAVVNLGELPGPGKRNLPVQFHSPAQGVRVVSMEPQELIVETDRKSELTFRIQAQTRKKPASGFEVKSIEPQPAFATVTGASRYVEKVSSLVAFVDIQGKSQGMLVNESLVALDAKGAPVLEVEISPSMVQLDVELAPIAIIKAEIVPRFTGGLPAGFKRGEPQPEPSTVSLAFSDGRNLTQYKLFTEQINLNERQATFTEQVKLVLPQGVVYKSADSVRVTVPVIRD